MLDGEVSGRHGNFFLICFSGKDGSSLLLNGELGGIIVFFKEAVRRPPFVSFTQERAPEMSWFCS